MEENKKLLSIIVPCYNEEQSLGIFHEEITRVLETIKNIDYEIILVNDGSKDKTYEIFLDLSSKDNHIKYISFSRNFGKEAAIYAGFSNAKGDYVVTMDADLQDPPYLLPQMLEILESSNYDSVATRRVTRDGESKIRSLFARMFYKIINKISDADVVDGARDYRLMKRKMVDVIISMSEYNRFSKGMFGWVGFKTYWLPFENVERVAGTSSWSFFGLVKYAVKGIISYSNFPLLISFFVGGIILFASLIMLVINIVCGFDVILTVIMMGLFSCGIISMLIGIIGLYLGNIYNETKDRPIYLVKDTNIENYR